MKIRNLLLLSLPLVFLSCEKNLKEKSEQQLKVETIIIKHFESPKTLKDVTNYAPVSFSEIDTLENYHLSTKDCTSFKVMHTYKATNVFSNEISRDVEILLDRDLNILKTEKK